jgi:thiol-disulfide isomerase/thioredoxin
MLSSAEQYAEAVRAPGVVVVRCTAEWCGPCRQIAQPYSQLQVDGVKFYSIDVEKTDDFADVGSVGKLPCFFIYRNGKPAGMVIGADLDALKKQVLSVRG